MARTRNEREDDERAERLEHMREQVSAGELVVRQMTPSERKHWKERSDAFDEHATSEERASRGTAWQKRQEREKRQQKRRDASPPH